MLADTYRAAGERAGHTDSLKLALSTHFHAGAGRQGAIMIGSAGEVTDKLLDARKVLGLDRIFAQVDWGGLPAGLVEESIARYATEIAPALRSV